MAQRGHDGRIDPLVHATVEKAGLYRAVMSAFTVARERFLVHLRPEDVHLGLPEPRPPVAEVEAALAQLEEWGNLRADHDTGRVTTVEDFHRARYLYQLTREGEAAEAALRAYTEGLGRRGALQRVALADVRVQLRELAALLDDAAPDESKLSTSLTALVRRVADLADNAQVYLAGLQRALDLTDADLAAFLTYKGQLLEYLAGFVSDLVVIGAEIAGDVLELDQRGIDALLVRQAARDAIDLPPDQRDGATARLEAAWRDRWSGIRAWFVRDGARRSQADLLRERTRAAITDLLTVVTARNSRREGVSDRAADFRTLAVWFAEAPSDDDRHRLWRAAFGLSSARHLTVDAETLEARQRAPVPPHAAWRDAPPVQVSPRLRATGRTGKRGRVPAVVDRTAAKRALAVRLAAQHVQTEAVRRRLATGRPTRLSALGPLDPEEFEAFLALLADVLGAVRDPHGTVRTTTGDGALDLVLEPAPDGAIARIVTRTGVLFGPDHRLTIVPSARSLPDVVSA